MNQQNTARCLIFMVLLRVDNLSYISNFPFMLQLFQFIAEPGKDTIILLALLLTWFPRIHIIQLCKRTSLQDFAKDKQHPPAYTIQEE